MTTARVILLKGAADLLARGSALITFPIIAAHAGADGYGAYGQVNTLVGFIVPFASLGIGLAMVRFFAARPWTPAAARQVLRVGAIVVGLSIVPTMVMAFLAGSLNDAFLNWPGGRSLFLWGSPLILLGAAEVWLLDLLRSRDWLVQYSLIQLGQTVLLVAAVAILLPAGFGIVALVQAAVVAKALALLVALATALAGAHYQADADDGDEEERPPALSAMVRFGLPLTVAGFGVWMINLSDRLVIGNVEGAAELGRYGAAYTLASLLVLASAPLMLPVYRRYMTSALQQDTDAIAADTCLFHRYLTLALIPFAVYLGVVAGPILELLGGPEFEAGTLLTTLLVAGLFLDQWNGLAHYLLVAFQRTVLLQNLWLACGLLNVALNIAVVPRYGIEGAAAVTLISFLALEAAVFTAASRSLPLWRLYRFDSAVRTILASGVAAAPVVFVLHDREPGPFVLLVATGCFGLVFLVAITALRELQRGDVALLMQTLGLRRVGKAPAA